MGKYDYLFDTPVHEAFANEVNELAEGMLPDGFASLTLDQLQQVRARLVRGVLIERERIALRFESEADLAPCAEDGVVLGEAALLVKADFSYAEMDQLRGDVETEVPAPAL